jgi:hypothetical protein
MMSFVAMCLVLLVSLQHGLPVGSFNSTAGPHMKSWPFADWPGWGKATPTINETGNGSEHGEVQAPVSSAPTGTTSNGAGGAPPPEGFGAGWFGTAFAGDWAETWQFEATTKGMFFSTRDSTGSISSEGWFLYFLDNFGVASFGNCWPWVAWSTIVCLGIGLLGVLSHSLRTICAPCTCLLH